MTTLDKAKPFSLRVSVKLRDYYHAEAKKNKRSLNSEFAIALDKQMNTNGANKGE